MSPATLRFLRFLPCVLLGYHQNPALEVDLDYLQEQGIDLQRRLTGGGAIYFDPKHLGWELLVDRAVFKHADTSGISRQICETVARGISTLGVDARFRPRNDIEVEGRKIGGTGAAFEGGSMLYQGTLLLDLNPVPMEKALRVVTEKFAGKRGHSHRDRVVGLNELLGEAPSPAIVKAAIADSIAREFGVTFEVEKSLRISEAALYRQSLERVDRREWVWRQMDLPDEPGLREAAYRCHGGTIRVSLRLDRSARRLGMIWVSGDFFVEPARSVADLESVLRDTRIADLEATVEEFFAARRVQMLNLQPRDFCRAIRKAVSTPSR